MKEPIMATFLKSLKRQQQKHVEFLAKVEKAAARLDRRKLKLSALEYVIADLERRIAEPRKGRGAMAEAFAGNRQAQLIFNPSSGRDDQDNAMRLSQIVSSLRSHGIEAVIGLKTSGKAARTLAREAARDKVPLVIVAAGDGTIADVAAELIGTSTVLGLVPIGTMNNVARSLGVPLDIDDACALIGMGTTRHIDLGRVHASEQTRDEYFLDCAGVGLAAIGAMAGQEFEKKRWRALPKVLQRFFQAKPGTMKIELDDNVIEASTHIVTVSNAPLMGNNLLAAPDAKMDDGYLDVSIYDGMGDAALVSHFLAASTHKPTDLKVQRARRVRVTTRPPMLANADMSVVPELSVVEIEVLPAALSMIVGNGIGLTHPVGSAPSAPTFARDPRPQSGPTTDIEAAANGAAHA